jgi:ATP phosphoribosyltransferase regulatory subunit
MTTPMSPTPSSLLLPEGLRDRLPPEAEAASQVTRSLIDAIRGYGYARVAPPLAEFRETLGGDAGETSGQDLLRLTDPVSRRTLAIRPDITRQVGRIATSRLAAAARPLRLCYAGQVVKLRANDLWPEREMLQAGAELIGSDSAEAAAEIVEVAVTALSAAGVTDITVDFTLPDCVDLLLANQPDRPAVAIKTALDGKDAGALAALAAADFAPLLAATGPFATAMAQLRAFDQHGLLSERLTALEAVAAPLAGRATITLDPTERHGFEYQSWFGFSLFVTGYRVTIGRGGSYDILHPDGRREAAIGFSLYPDPLIEAGLGAANAIKHRLFLPIGHDAALAAALRADGWVTVAALTVADDGPALGCTHCLLDGATVPY